MNPKRTDEWVSKGILSACECFSCANKMEHKFRETKVSIHCLEPCKYKPLRGEERPAVDKLQDIEQIA